MKAAIVKIGNSRGIRIPKPVFEQCGFTNEVELKVENHRLVVRSSSRPRASWEESFSLMAKERDEFHRDAENFHYERNERARKNGTIDVRFVSRDLVLF